MDRLPSCLGDGDYAVRIVRRATLLGPAHPLGELPTLESGAWARAPQMTTDASVVVALQETGCADLLNRTEPWRDRMELYRGDDEVWSGPILNVVADPGGGTATVTAKDNSAWWDVRALTKNFVHRQVDLAEIMAAYLEWAFRLDDPGIDLEVTPSGILGDRTVDAADLRMLASELGELGRTGCDWTVTARRFWIGAAHGTLPIRLTDEAFRTPPQTRRSGEGMANETFVRGNGVQGHAGGPDPQDGVLLQRVRDEQSIEDEGSANASAKSWRARVAEPMTYLEGDNALETTAPVDVQTLIPGVLVPVDVTGGGVVPLNGTLRLESVRGSWGPEGETINVALQPVGDDG